MRHYQFERIFSQMQKEVGKVRSGQEDKYAMMLLSIESNALKTHRKFPDSNSRSLINAIALALFTLKERYTGETFDTDSFRDDQSHRLEVAILMAFDPFTNEELKTVLTDQIHIDLSDIEKLRDYYVEPIRCLLRIKESVDKWIKNNGSNGYFDFIESFMGSEINGDDMTYSVLLPKQEM